MPPAGFEPVIPTSDRPQILALDRSATGIGTCINNVPDFLLERSINECKMDGAFSLYEIRYEYVLIRKPENVIPVGKLRWCRRKVEMNIKIFKSA